MFLVHPLVNKPVNHSFPTYYTFPQEISLGRYAHPTSEFNIIAPAAGEGCLEVVGCGSAGEKEINSNIQRAAQ